MAGTVNPFNPYKDATLQSNWYEDRFFHANTRGDPFVVRTRSRDDEIEHIPRVTRKMKPIGEVFQFQNDETAEEHFRTVSQATWVRHPPETESITARRMNTPPEELRDMLGARPSRHICNHALKYRGPEKQFTTIYRKDYVRHL
jgi:hypothetical protein